MRGFLKESLEGFSMYIPLFLGKINFRLSFIHFSFISKMSFL